MNPGKGIALALALEIDKRDLHYCVNEHCAEPCGDMGNDLACVNDFAWPEIQAHDGRLDVTVEVTTTVDIQKTEPLPGATVRLCADLQHPCSPLETAVTDAAGRASLPTRIGSEGFRGFAQFVSGPDTPELYPTDTYLGWAVGESTYGFQVVPTADVVGLVVDALAGGIVEGRGHLAVAFYDCAFASAAGIRVELPAAVTDAETAHLYFPSGGTETGTSGIVAVYNVMPGCYQVVGTHLRSGATDPEDRVETHRVKVVVEPNTATWIYAVPTSSAPDIVHVCVDDFVF